MTWNLIVAQPARKELNRLPPESRARILSALREMANDPHAGDIVRLKAPASAGADASATIASSTTSTRPSASSPFNTSPVAPRPPTAGADPHSAPGNLAPRRCGASQL